MAFDPIRYPQEEDIFRIGGVASPGISTFSGFERVYGWEVKKGKGVKGSTVTLNEFPPVEGQVEIQLWLPEHFDAWNAFRPLLKYDPTKKTSTALDWYQQSTEDIELKSVVCKGFSPRVHKGKGLYVVTVKFIEYNPPPKKSAVATPNGSKGGTSSGTPGASSDPIADAKQAEIARLLKQANQP